MSLDRLALMWCWRRHLNRGICRPDVCELCFRFWMLREAMVRAATTDPYPTKDEEIT